MSKRRQRPPGAARQIAKKSADLIDSWSPRLQAAQRLWNGGQHADGLSLFSESVRQEPNNVRAYIATARAHAEHFDFASMERIHEMLLRVAPRHPGAHHYMGETYGLLKKTDRAVASLQRAAELPGAGPPTWLELAQLYERAHLLDESESLIEQTVRSGFKLPLVAIVRGRIQRRRKRPEEAEATFHELIQRIPEDSEWACQAWGELAQLRDEQGDWNGAIQAIEHCKQVQKRHEAPHWAASENMQTQMRQLIEGITSDDFCRWRHELANLPQQRVALLTGFPRSGTTLLEQLLDAHPDLVSSEERDFLGRDLLHNFMSRRGKTPFLDVLNERGVAEIDAQRRRYFESMEYLIDEPIAGRMHLDKNPSYNLMIPLMLRLFPEARLVIALRDPRDVVLSCYLRYLPLNSVSVRFLDVQRTAERYAFDMAAWLRFRDLIETQWCEIRYEDVVSDVESQARKALAMLGLEWDSQVLEYRQRLATTKRVNSPSYEAVAQPISKRAVGRWKNYEKYMEPALATVDPFISEFGYN
jgi:tetratricopeptide (TPR) repeat protein